MRLKENTERPSFFEPLTFGCCVSCGRFKWIRKLRRWCQTCINMAVSKELSKVDAKLDDAERRIKYDYAD